jgi:hypothetical protein
MKPRDSAELHNLPLIVGVVLGKRKDTGGLDNQIARFSAKNGLPLTPPAVHVSSPNGDGSNLADDPDDAPPW